MRVRNIFLWELHKFLDYPYATSSLEHSGSSAILMPGEHPIPFPLRETKYLLQLNCRNMKAMSALDIFIYRGYLLF